MELSLCLSRACLGKRIILRYKWRKKYVVLTDYVRERADDDTEHEAANDHCEDDVDLLGGGLNDLSSGSGSGRLLVVVGLS